MIPKEGARIMGLDNPTAKMSKSDESEYHAIYLLDAPDLIRKKCMRAVTDSGREIRFSDDPEKAGVNNLLTIYQSVTGKTREAVEGDFASARGYGDLKKAVGEAVVESLSPLQQTYQQWMDDKGALDAILARSAEKARAAAEKTLSDVKEKLGFVPTSS
jgi:tryptophanyl-tRNA synthetase